ncbi:hypothetical protein HHI36_002268 [Cryptolaemus montrouzieri]|uniref:Protein-cysteine N-palmitoyltransferase Rasp n=1 Tax=Cryptolaemus montrouzieri TaxID=559131 RepID=A0ABD2PA03_9CUCU
MYRTIHLYSDMWKYFDNGLYKFLLRYIYIPAMKSSYFKNKLIASLLCFIFVYVWHGVDLYIFIWVFLNFFGILIENISVSFYNTHLKDLEIVEYFGKSTIRRITCFLASFVLAISAISNFYFFAGINIGTIFFTRVLEGSFTSNAVLILALYCCCQFSTELQYKSTSQKNEKQL